MNASDLLKYSAAKIAVRNVITAKAASRHAFNKQIADFRQLLEAKNPHLSAKAAQEKATEMVLIRWILDWELEELKRS